MARGSPIPGVSGRRIPGTARMPQARSLGGFQTNVPFIPKEEGGSRVFGQYHRQQVRDTGGRFASGGWGMAWIGLETTDNDIYRWAEGKVQNVRQLMEEVKDAMVADAKAGTFAQEVWEDQTTDARQGLQGTVVQQGPAQFTIFLGHGANVHYGIWLEVRWGG